MDPKLNEQLDRAENAVKALETEVSFLRNSNSWQELTLLAAANALKMAADQTMKDLPALATERQARLDVLEAAVLSNPDLEAAVARIGSVATKLEALVPPKT